MGNENAKARYLREKAERGLKTPVTAPPQLSAEDIDRFRRHPGTFAEMVQHIYASGWRDAQRITAGVKEDQRG